MKQIEWDMLERKINLSKLEINYKSTESMTTCYYNNTQWNKYFASQIGVASIVMSVSHGQHIWTSKATYKLHCFNFKITCATD